MSNEKDETVMHILSEHSKLAQKCHDKVIAMVHWKLCSKYGFESVKHWYEHRAERVIENQDIKILQDFNIRTNCVKEARRPDIVLIKKNNQETFIIDMAITMDFRVRDQKTEKISKHQDLALEISRML